jgi:hypothetical protein
MFDRVAGMDANDLVTAEHTEQLRRSLVMLAPGQPCGFTREEAMLILGRLVALQRAARQAVSGDACDSTAGQSAPGS